MVVDATVPYLEMTAPDQLVPGRPPRAPVQMQETDRASLELVRSTYDRIGAPHQWQSRQGWSDEQWDEWLSRPGVRVWIARVDGEVAGMVELEVQPGGDVEMVVFGLVPEFVGSGFGGHLLTVGVRLAWEVKAPDGTATRRVWLHTSTRDHPHAKPNYERRGFRPFRTEHTRRVIPG